MTNENNENLETKNRFNKHFIFWEKQNDTQYSSFGFDFIYFEKNIDEQSAHDFDINLNEFNSDFSTIFPNFEFKKAKIKIFYVIHRKRISVFTNTENGENCSSTDNTFLKRKRYPEKRRRRENQDNMRKKIKRGFLNKALIKNINENIKNIESKLYLEKFPQKLSRGTRIRTAQRVNNCKIFEMKRNEISNPLFHFLNKIYHTNLKISSKKNRSKNITYEDSNNDKYLFFHVIYSYFN